jgi:ferritin-like metal-binding protein YciE
MKIRREEKQTTRRSTRTAWNQPRYHDIRDAVIDWLQEAYAMERGLETLLEKQAKNEDLRPELRDRAAAHLEETHHHADEVKSALHSLDAPTSGLKTAMIIMVQATKGLSTVLARDERIKDLLNAYATEHLEIACYTALAAAAKKADLPRVVKACQRMLPDEERMAQALLKSLSSEVSDYLFESEAAAV